MARFSDSLLNPVYPDISRLGFLITISTFWFLYAHFSISVPNYGELRGKISSIKINAIWPSAEMRSLNELRTWANKTKTFRGRKIIDSHLSERTLEKNLPKKSKDKTPSILLNDSGESLTATENLSKIQLKELNEQRLFLLNEIHDSNLGENILDAFVPEKGGTPMRTLVFTTWRSGSSFLGGILNSHPGTFYHYEPLVNFGSDKLQHNLTYSFKAIQFIQDLLTCDTSNQENFEKYVLKHKHHQKNFRLYPHWHAVNKGSNYPDNVTIEKGVSTKLRQDAEFFSRMCNLFPFHVMKLVRLDLKHARSLLRNHRLNIKVIYLVRDPRGTMQSRYHPGVWGWCSRSSACGDPAKVCYDLVDDYKHARKFQKEFPNKFLIVRYEDMSASINPYVEKMFRFLQLNFTESTKQFLDSHTSASGKKTYGIYRNTEEIQFGWISAMKKNFSLFSSIQKSCKTAMNVWGYKAVKSSNELDEPFKLLLPLVMPK